jgi:hypothetical protein
MTLNYFGPAINALYAACLLAPESVKTSARDLWGNVKIPLLDALSSEGPDHNPWVAIDHSQGVAYASLTGLMIAGLPSEGLSNFTLDTQYLDLACSDETQVQADALNATLDGRITYHNSSDLFLGPVPTYETTSPNSFFVDTNTKTSDLLTYKAYPNLVYGSNNGGGQGIWLYNCNHRHYKG